MIKSNPYYELKDPGTTKQILEHIEQSGRTCYKSEEKMDHGWPNAPSRRTMDFVRMIIKRGHESVLEHRSMTVKFVCNRGVTHEMVRHRLSSFSQESTRYCNYTNERFGAEIEIINNPASWYCDERYKGMGQTLFEEFEQAMADAERHYFNLIELGWGPQQARNVLPIGLKSEIDVTANFRQWRLMFKQRTAPVAHPQMRQLMRPLLIGLQRGLPVLFEDIELTDTDEFV